MLPALLLGLLAHAAPVTDLQEDLRVHPWRYAAGSAPVASAPASQAVVSPPAPAPSAAEKPLKPKPAKESSPATSARWSIQLASLSNEESALQRKQELESVLGPGSLAIVPAAGAWKLRHGAYTDRKEAQKAREELKKKGLDGFVVEP